MNPILPAHHRSRRPASPQKPARTAPVKGNYAFIDAQNIHRGTRAAGWLLNWAQLREYLRTEQRVTKAFLFIGFLEGQEPLYASLKMAGYELIFKPTVKHTVAGKTVIKGNVDTDLVLKTMLEWNQFDQAILLSGDGDFLSLLTHLSQAGKLKSLVVSDARSASKLLAPFSRSTVSLDSLRSRLSAKTTAPTAPVRQRQSRRSTVAKPKATLAVTPRPARREQPKRIPKLATPAAPVRTRHRRRRTAKKSPEPTGNRSSALSLL
ncbi:MAG: NYN domain-containing protein [Candidatus Peribacteraceae bacterium]|nr:NYN domain-containing protein [Candidatus Peribacteraceae bacterium]